MIQRRRFFDRSQTGNRDDDDTLHDKARRSSLPLSETASLPQGRSSPLVALDEIEFCAPGSHCERSVALLIDVTLLNITEDAY